MGERACIGLGANLGDPVAMLRQTVGALRELAIEGEPRMGPQASGASNIPDGTSTSRTPPGVDMGFRVSDLYRSAPVDADGPDYFNAVVSLYTDLQPDALLTALQALEALGGRVRSYVNSPRTLDLDLLLYGDMKLHSTRLILPHPRMHERAFVLRPLLDVEASNRQIGQHGTLRALEGLTRGQRIEKMPSPWLA
jgi:2-amino-4-hydroxy-6-hydroxymethyldihydropteridine diphosphokinase